MGGGEVVGERLYLSEVDLSRHHDASTNDVPKVLDRWGGGVQGHINLGNFCNCGPEESTFPAFYGPGFKENITLEV